MNIYANEQKILYVLKNIFRYSHAMLVLRLTGLFNPIGVFYVDFCLKLTEVFEFENSELL